MLGGPPHPATVTTIRDNKEYVAVGSAYIVLYEPYSKLLKGGVRWGIIWMTIIGDIQGGY